MGRTCSLWIAELEHRFGSQLNSDVGPNPAVHGQVTWTRSSGLTFLT